MMVSPCGRRWSMAMPSALVTTPASPPTCPPGSTAVTWNQPKAGGGGLSGLREFTANGSFVAPAGVTHVVVEAWGGGGVQTRRRAGGHRPLQRLLRCAERGSVIGDTTR